MLSVFMVISLFMVKVGEIDFEKSKRSYILVGREEVYSSLFHEVASQSFVTKTFSSRKKC
jgi:hypothetical protein